MTEMGQTSPQPGEMRQRRSTATLLTDLVDDMMTLVRKEGELARAEITENADKARRSVGAFAAGAICLIAALVVLLDALVIGLANLGIPAGWSALIVGAIVAAIGFWLLNVADRDIEGAGAMPSKTMQQIREDAEAVRRSFKR